MHVFESHILLGYIDALFYAIIHEPSSVLCQHLSHSPTTYNPNPFHDERHKLNIGPDLPRVSVGVKIVAFTSLCDAPHAALCL